MDLNGVPGLGLLNTIGTVKTMVTHELEPNAFCIRDVNCEPLGARGERCGLNLKYPLRFPVLVYISYLEMLFR